MYSYRMENLIRFILICFLFFFLTRRLTFQSIQWLNVRKRWKNNTQKLSWTKNTWTKCSSTTTTTTTAEIWYSWMSTNTQCRRCNNTEGTGYTSLAGTAKKVVVLIFFFLLRSCFGGMTATNTNAWLQSITRANLSKFRVRISLL